jgi:CubicO group peptidase (beta-lactamase class C family)
MEQLRGYVHDEGAAMMGGVSGNAGLFSNAVDLAKLHQMYLWGGKFGGRRYLSEEAMKEFTSYQYSEYDNRRGLGFDKPLVGNDTLPPSEAYPSHSASPSSFGHSGYTGTLVWADPENGLLYIFLSNRVYPTRENSKLYDLNIRSNILETFYTAIENRKSYEK